MISRSFVRCISISIEKLFSIASLKALKEFSGIFFELIIVVGGWKYKPELLKTFSSIGIDLDSTNTHEIGKVLYTDYIHLFQLSGMVLLVSMIGAIVLTFRKREGIKRQSYFRQISRERTEGVELVEPKNNEGVKIDV